MAEHFSVRLPKQTTDRLARRASRLHSAPRTLAQRYIEEGLRRDEHPLVHFVDGPSGRRARLLGSGLDVWEVVATVRDNADDIDEATSYLGVSRGLVEAAVSYYGAFRDEVDAEIVANEEEWERGYAAWWAGRRALEP